MEKYSTLGAPAKASIWYTFCNVLQKGIAFIVVPIYTRLLTKAEYGLYSTFQSWRDIIIIFATLNLYCGVFTKAMVDLKDDRDSYTSSMQGLSTIISVLLFIAYCPFRNAVNSFIEMDFSTVCLMFAYYIFYPAFLFWSVRQRVEYKYVKMIIVTLLIAVLIPMISLLLLYYSDLREKAVIWGYLLVNIVIGFCFYVINFSKGKLFFSKCFWKRALIFNLPLIPHYLALIVLGQSDRIMIQKMVGDDEVAIYSLAYQVSMLMTIVISGIDNALVPWEYERFKNKDFSIVSSVCIKIAVAIGILVFFTVLVSPEIVLILGGEKYIDSIKVIPPVAVSVFFIFLYGLFCSIEFYYGSTQYVMIASSTAALLNICLNYFFIRLAGYIAAGYTTLFCYMYLACMHFFFAGKVKRKNGIKEKIYDARGILFLSFLFLTTLPISILLFAHSIVRYCLICVLVLITIFKRKRIVELTERIKSNAKD